MCRVDVTCDRYPDVQTCVASTLFLPPQMYSTYAQDVATGTIVFDAASAARCATLYDNPACTQTFNAEVGRKIGALCAGVLTGTVALGGACFFGDECAGSAACGVTDPSCIPGFSCCAGTCRAPTTTILPLGGDCSSPQTMCGSGLQCDYGSFVPVCVSLPDTVGARCSSVSGGCASPLYCTTPSGGVASCAMPVTTGGRCDPGPSASAGSCENLRDSCDLASSTCVPPSVWEACGSEICSRYAYCDPTTNTCVALPGPGQGCTAGSACLGLLQCDPIAKTCMLPSAASCW